MSCNTNCSNPDRVLPNAWAELSNTTGNLTITPTRPNTTVDLTVGGVARESLFVLSRVRRRAGDILLFQVTLAAVAGIVMDFRNGSEGGAALLPANKFPSQQFTTDGEITTAMFRFVYTGGAWKYVDSQIPA